MMAVIDDLLVIPYGAATWPIDRLGGPDLSPGISALDGAGPVVAIERGKRAPLRLNTMPYAFAEPPDLIRLTEPGARLDFLRDHLKSLCGLWDKLPRLFLDAYFRFIAERLEAGRGALETVSAASGGLFGYRDWSYSALRPLPRAHLYAPEKDAPRAHWAEADWVRVDFAFWTGEALCAVEIQGATTRNRLRAEGHERLRRQGVAVIEVPGAALRREGGRAELLPAAFAEFWKTENLPASPFRIGRLDEILQG